MASPATGAPATGTMLAGLVAPLAVMLQLAEMRKWRGVLKQETTAFDADEARRRLGNLELLPKLRQVLQLAMGPREVVGMIVFCALFLVKSAATWRRVSANASVLEAFAYGKNRQRCVIDFCMSSLALAGVDSLITHARFWLIASIRETLSASCHRLMMQRERFARAKYEPECDAATSVPHYCGEFAEHMAELPYYFLSPMFDAGASLFYFAQSMGGRASKIVAGTTLASLLLIRVVQPDVARLHASVVAQEGAFQQRHFRVQENCEAISMASGSQYYYNALNSSLHRVYAASCRYAAGTANFFLLFRTADLVLWDVVPLLLWLADSTLQGEAAVRTLVLQRDAASRFNKSIAIVFKNIREISHLKEFTHKLTVFLNALSQVDTDSNAHDPAVEPPRVAFAERAVVAEFTDVELRTPAQVVLLSRFSLRVDENTTWLIAGPNGTGKTSLFRVLAGLWPVAAGHVRVADDAKILCLPQQSFLLRNKATLRDQLWFPVYPPEAPLPGELAIAQRSLALSCNEQLLELVGGWSSHNCGFLPSAEPIADADFSWQSLSGGQNQKLALARLFFSILLGRAELSPPASPLVADDAAGRAAGLASSIITTAGGASVDVGSRSARVALAKLHAGRFLVLLDESTSQVDSAAEQTILRNLKQMARVTVMCISHRRQMARHADFVLLLGGAAPVVQTRAEFEATLAVDTPAASPQLRPSTPA